MGSTKSTDTSTLDGTKHDLAQPLKHLLCLANDLCLAYGTAIRRIEDADLRAQLREIDKSHDRHRVELADFIRQLGAKPPAAGDLHGLVERGRVVLAELGGDRGILQAMSVNESELSSAYRVARSHPGLPSEALVLIDRMLQHEHHHRRFYDDALGRFVG